MKVWAVLGAGCPECQTWGCCWCQRQNARPKLLVDVKVHGSRPPATHIPLPPALPRGETATLSPHHHLWSGSQAQPARESLISQGGN